jgi:hypothetical protein
MRIFGGALLVVSACFALPENAQAQALADPIPAKIHLFNGKDFEGLFVYVGEEGVPVNDVWKIEDGMLRCTGVSKGYVRTINAYADYKVKLEWREGTAGSYFTSSIAT